MDERLNGVEVETPEEMLNEVEQRILEEIREMERTIIDRKSADAASVQAAFLGRLVSRRNVLLRRCDQERRRA